MITAKMNNDKYIELSPGWPYEVVKYESGKIKLKGIPRIYPASDLQLLRDGEPITEETLKRILARDEIKETFFMIFTILLLFHLGAIGFLVFSIGCWTSEFIIGYVLLGIASLIWVITFLIFERWCKRYDGNDVLSV